MDKRQRRRRLNIMNMNECMHDSFSCSYSKVRWSNAAYMDGRLNLFYALCKTVPVLSSIWTLDKL